MTTSFDKALDLIKNKHWNIGFHGSAQDISKFDDHKVGAGADLNSSLGLFLSYLPEKALEYAQSACEFYREGGVPFVYAVCFPAKGVFEFRDREEFYGIDEHGSPSRACDDFSNLRRELSRDGFDCAEFEDGEDSMAVVLKPSKAIIIAVLDENACESLSGHEFDAMATLINLKENGLLLETSPNFNHERSNGLSL